MIMLRESQIDGCLKLVNNRCVVCDIFNFYYLSNNTCIKSNFEKCTMISHDGKCIVCEKNYYLASDNKCVQIMSGSLVDGCLFYENKETCSLCDKGKLLLKNRCNDVSSTSVIENC